MRSRKQILMVVDTEEQKEEWRKDPGKYREYRKIIEGEMNVRFKSVLKNSYESDEANRVSNSNNLSNFTD